MSFEIPNQAGSVVYAHPDGDRYPQAEVDNVDVDILIQGLNGEGVLVDCAVTPKSPESTSVAVASGIVQIGGAGADVAAGDVDCGAAHGSLPRFDLIVVNSSGTKSVVNGTAALIPVFPEVAANSVALAVIWRAAADDTIATADIVDKRAILFAVQTGSGAPTHVAPAGTLYVDMIGTNLYYNTDGATTWQKAVKTHPLLNAVVHTDVNLGAPGKGRTIAGDGSNWDDLAVGPNDSFLVPDSGAALGLKYVNAAAVMAILSGQAGANFSLNSKKLTALAAASASGDAVRYEQALLTSVGRTLAATITVGASGKINVSGIAGEISVQKGTTAPSHDATIGTPYWDYTNKKAYFKHAAGAGAGNWTEIGAGGNGGSSHAPVGALYPGVLSTGVKPPQMPYRGDNLTIDKLYCRASVAPQGQAITVQIRKGGVSMGTVTIAAAAQTGEADVDVAIVSGDYFDINITQVGTSPNQGSDLVWLCVP